MASTREWFETVEEARRRARRHLPRSVYMSLVAGTEQGVTLRDNVAAFSELRFAPPHIADLPATRQQATSVLGQDIALPVIASPTGVQAVHPEGEVGVARGAAEAGTAMGLSSFASMPVEDVAAANQKLFFQVYWSGSKDTILQRIERARRAGAKALIVTLDWSFSNGRDWGSPAIPEKMDLRTIIRLAPEGLTRPGYVGRWLRGGVVGPRRLLPGMCHGLVLIQGPGVTADVLQIGQTGQDGHQKLQHLGLRTVDVGFLVQRHVHQGLDQPQMLSVLTQQDQQGMFGTARLGSTRAHGGSLRCEHQCA